MEEPQPPKSPADDDAVALVLVVDVVGFESLHAFDEPQASKFDVRFIAGDFAAAGAGAGAG